MSIPALHIENLSVYYGQTLALAGVCLDVAEGEYLGIIGPNGGGKSTLMKAVLGLIPIASGKIRLFGDSFEKSKGSVGYVPQFSTLDKKFPISVREVVLTGCIKKGLSPLYRYTAQDKVFVDSLLEKVGIAGLANRQISALSGGEFQKMLIARGLAVKPRLLLLDEPTASVDAKSREQIFGLLAELNKSMTILLVTHDLMAVTSEAKRLACLNRELIYHGGPALNEHVMNTLYGYPADFIARDIPNRGFREHEGGCCHD